jgi:haloalkane dehalogenase
MDASRTPDQQFARLPGYPSPARSLVLDPEGGLRMAYVAEGAHENRPVLLLHGPPTWSYLWRRVLPMLVEGGCRVVAPDLVGFGRSDKPLRTRDHRLDRHVAWVMALVDALDLRQATVVAHGAAMPLALRLVAGALAERDRDGERERFSRLVGVCPVFAAGDLAPDDQPASEQVARGCADPLSEAARAGHDAPFPDPELGAGLRAQQQFLPGTVDLPAFEIPILAVAGERDERSESEWTSLVPGSVERRRRLTIAGAGHYLPEDRGPELALALLAFLGEKL